MGRGDSLYCSYLGRRGEILWRKETLTLHVSCLLWTSAFNTENMPVDEWSSYHTYLTLLERLQRSQKGQHRDNPVLLKGSKHSLKSESKLKPCTFITLSMAWRMNTFYLNVHFMRKRNKYCMQHRYWKFW